MGKSQHYRIDTSSQGPRRVSSIHVNTNETPGGISVTVSPNSPISEEGVEEYDDEEEGEESDASTSPNSSPIPLSTIPLQEQRKRPAPPGDITHPDRAKKQFSPIASLIDVSTLGGLDVPKPKHVINSGSSGRDLTASNMDLIDQKISKDELDRLLFSIPLEDAKEADPLSETALVT
jgi:hypothetical protein